MDQNVNPEIEVKEQVQLSRLKELFIKLCAHATWAFILWKLNAPAWAILSFLIVREKLNAILDKLNAIRDHQTNQQKQK